MLFLFYMYILDPEITKLMGKHGPAWVLTAPDGLHDNPMNLSIWLCINSAEHFLHLGFECWRRSEKRMLVEEGIVMTYAVLDYNYGDRGGSGMMIAVACGWQSYDNDGFGMTVAWRWWLLYDDVLYDDDDDDGSCVMVTIAWWWWLLCYDDCCLMIVAVLWWWLLYDDGSCCVMMTVVWWWWLLCDDDCCMMMVAVVWWWLLYDDGGCCVMMTCMMMDVLWWWLVW